MRIRTILAGAVYALCVLAAAAGAATVQVYPVPWAPESGRGDDRYGTLAGGITFKNISGPGEILIYTVTGELVRSIAFSAESEKKWDGKNSDNSFVASGVYLWVVKGDGTAEKGKLIVIR